MLLGRKFDLGDNDEDPPEYLGLRQAEPAATEGRRESPRFLFVSHVSEDRPVALEIVDKLEGRGVRCWISPRDLHAGSPFDDEIADAIDACGAMLLIFSGRCNESEYIRREVTVAGEARKIIIPFRIEDSKPQRGLRVRLSDLHWIDAFPTRDRAIEELAKALDKLASKDGLT